MLETEFDNAAALSLYESLGFIREKRLYRFYLNGKDAFRLVLVVTPVHPGSADADADDSDVSDDADMQVPLLTPSSVALPPALTTKRLPGPSATGSSAGTGSGVRRGSRLRRYSSSGTRQG